MNRTRKLLSIDGGGIKGVLAAAFLETVEEATGKRVAEHFDLIVGTSTGGIIALGLGLGMSAREIVQFYVNEGPGIFDQIDPLDPAGWGNRVLSMLRGKTRQARQFGVPKYDPSALRQALERAFKAAQLGDSKVRLAIPAYHADKEDVYVFKTRHHERLQVDWRESAVDVALATAAAPTYFAAHQMPSGAPLIDGVRISAIVDACFRLIVDGETASSRARRGGAQAPGVIVPRASTISLKRPSTRVVRGLVLGLD